MSKTTIVIPTNLPNGQQGEVRSTVQGQEQRGYDDYAPMGYHSKMAALAGMFAGAGVLGIFCMVMWWFPGTRPYYAHFGVIALAAGLIVSAWFGFNWIREGATRAWRVADKERKRRWKIEDSAMSQGEEDEEEEEEAKSEGWKLELTGYRILIMHYVDDLMCTRPECEAKGIDQVVWAQVNEVLKALRLKGERKWMEDVTLDEALRRWKEDAWFMDDGRVRVRSGDGKWDEVV